MGRQHNKYRTAVAHLRTVAQRPDEEAEVEVLTTATYQYGTCKNAVGRITKKTSSGGSVAWRLPAGDIKRLARGWSRTFDLAAGVVQNVPLSIDWSLELVLNGGSAWERGAVEAVVYTIAHELGIEVHSGN
jgi:hypothetical protein